MTWKLFLDDERDIGVIDDNDNWYVARDFYDARALVIKQGLPDFISFDHDLGDGVETGADFANWLIDYMLNKSKKFPANFDYYVHSMNPPGAANIRAKMEAAIKHIGHDDIS